MSDKKNVLIISYYWPPSGGAGVHRWLKISKYLSKHHNCFVYTPENPDFALKDESLLDKIAPNITVIKRKIFEPYFIYKAFLGKKSGQNINMPSSLDKSKSKGSLKNLAIWIRGNLFIPDPRVFWVNPSFRYLKKTIITKNIDVVITTGPPHSMHLIGLKLKQYFGSKINWITDFRDPWTNIDFYDKLNISSTADKKHKKLEKNVIQNCDTLVTVSASWANDYKLLGAKNVQVLTNGFDKDDYVFNEKTNSDFCLTHIGSINEDRNPHALWQALKEILDGNKSLQTNLKIKLIGNIHQSVLDNLAALNLDQYLIQIPYLPHAEALSELYNSTISLLLLNDTKNISGIIPGKIFEYIGVGNPIYAIGKPDGDSGKIITNNEIGTITDFDNIEGAKAVILKYFDDYTNKKLTTFSNDNLRKFSIENISKSFEKLF